MLVQVRIHGRGGQGVVTAAELLSVAAFREGRHAQAFPSFGSERIGAPVVAFCRISDHEIRAHEPIASPDALIIQDPTLLHQACASKSARAARWRWCPRRFDEGPECNDPSAVGFVILDDVGLPAATSRVIGRILAESGFTRRGRRRVSSGIHRRRISLGCGERLLRIGDIDGFFADLGHVGPPGSVRARIVRQSRVPTPVRGVSARCGDRKR
jgi:hypothetical protein